MTKPKYFSIDEMLEMIDEPNRTGYKKLLRYNRRRFQNTYGSVHNHQSWKGGYLDHITEIMNYAILFYNLLVSIGRPLPFTLSDALLILFVHDIEKPWKYRRNKKGVLEVLPKLRSKEAQFAFQLSKIARYNIVLNDYQLNGLKFVEGENNNTYNQYGRTMNELAKFCNLCDSWSARGAYQYPLAENDPWAGASRCNPEAK